MKIDSVMNALRVGASVKNQTTVKWASIAVTVALIALSVAQSAGYLSDVSTTQVVELVMGLVVLYGQFATTDKIGILPAKPKADQASE